jgi:hypothetical protein
MIVVTFPLLLALLPAAATTTEEGPLKNGSKSGMSNDISSVADDSGPARSLVIENDVSGKALAKEASKASRLLSRPNDDDGEDELVLGVDDDLLDNPDEPARVFPPPLPRNPEESVVVSIEPS